MIANSRPTTQNSFRLALDGFFGEFASVEALKAHVASLKGRFPSLVGKTAKVWQGVRNGDACIYSSAPALIVVGAV